MQPLYNMVPSCAAPIATASTDALEGVVGTPATNGGVNFGTSDLQCTSQVVNVLPNAAEVNDALFCGFYQVRAGWLNDNRCAKLWCIPSFSFKYPVLIT